MTITRALITQKIDNYHYTVRIPSLNKSAGANGSTPDAELYTACISTTPGIVPAYSNGAAVYVGFESDDCSAPVIIGALLNNDTVKIQNDVYTTSLNVSTNATLPLDTKIGNVSADNIRTLEGQTVRIKSEFERLNSFNEETAVQFSEIKNTIIYMQEHDDKADLDAARMAKRVEKAEFDITTNKDNIAQLNSSLNAVSKQLTSHSSDNSIHVTTDDKSRWNNHVKNEIIHVTDDNKTAWNNAVTHTVDTTVHITAAERSKWNNKADSSHTHTYLDNVGIGTSTLTTIILNSASYGSTLPANPKEGQLFFLIES